MTEFEKSLIAIMLMMFIFILFLIFISYDTKMNSQRHIADKCRYSAGEVPIMIHDSKFVCCELGKCGEENGS